MELYLILIVCKTLHAVGDYRMETDNGVINLPAQLQRAQCYTYITMSREKTIGHNSNVGHGCTNCIANTNK